MADYIEPTQEQFNTAEAATMDALKTSCPTAMTKVGSVVRELVIRPMSYLYAWAIANISNLQLTSSVAYLKTSSLTENELADQVASNYFITRNEGGYAKGLITLTISTPFARISAGSAFSIGGYNMVVEKNCVLVTGDDDYESDDTTMYIKMQTITTSSSTTYVGNIPVTAAEEGKIELVEGTEVTVNFANSFVISAELTSAITGGATTETDAEMMQRCEYNTASAGIGSYNGLRKKLNNAPVTVTGLAVVAGEDDPIFRARYNNTNVNPGGYVDAYVRTQSQESVTDVAIDMSTVTKTTGTTGHTTYTFTIPSTACPGFYSVRKVTSSDDTVSTFNVTYGSADATVSSDGARLSCKQTATVSFTSINSALTSITVYLAYMPDIDVINDYMTSDTNRFIGQDICIKAAVPVTLQITASAKCSTTLEDSELETLRNTIADYINDLPVGTAQVNFSDIRRVCAEALPKADLVLPCSMAATCYLTDGTRDNWYSNTGILRIAETVNTGYWSYKLSFFSTTPDMIRIEQE